MELIIWLGIIELLWLAGFPLAFFFLQKLPDRGFSVAPVLGLLLGAYSVWLAASLGLSFSPVLSWSVSLLIFGGLNAWLLLRKKGQLRKQLAAYFRARWKIALIEQLLFLIFFFVLIVLRSYVPEILGSEKFSDYSLYLGILNSSKIPANDLWLDGFPQNYYYFGHFMVAYLTHLSGIRPEIVYNLFLALIFGMTATAGFGLGYNLYNNRRARRAAVVVGLLTAMFSTITGNLDPVRQLAAPGERDKANCSGMLDNSLCFWVSPSRIIYDTRPERDENGQVKYKPDGSVDYLTAETINEFPAFTFLLGDLHPHLIAFPYFLFALALMLNFWRLPGGLPNRFRFNARELVTFGIMALLLGVTYFINTWNYPSALVLFAIAVVWREWRGGKIHWLRLGIYLLGLTLISLLSIGPFLASFRSFSGGSFIYSAFDYPVIREISRNVSVAIWDKTLLRQHFLIFGLFDYCLITFMVIKLRPYFKTNPALAWVKTAKTPRPLYLLFPAGLVLIAASLLMALAGMNPLLALTVGLLCIPVLAVAAFRVARAKMPLDNLRMKRLVLLYVWAVIWLIGFICKIETLGLMTGGIVLSGVLFWQESRLRRTNDNDRFCIALISFSSVLLLLLEIFFLRDQFEHRGNTVYKYYLQIWFIFGLLSAYTIVRLAKMAGKFKRQNRIAWAVGLLTLISLTLIYPVLGSIAHTNRFYNLQGLNGELWLQRDYPGDYAAISWLREQANQNEAFVGTILEVSGLNGTDAARVSTFSGFPALIGWVDHELLWHSFDKNLKIEVNNRNDLARQLYLNEDINFVQKILREYNIKYVFVGQLEESLKGLGATDASLNKFGKFMTLVYDKNNVKIYRIPN